MDAIILVDVILYQDHVNDLNLWLGDLNNDESLDVNDVVSLISIILEG